MPEASVQREPAPHSFLVEAQYQAFDTGNEQYSANSRERLKATGFQLDSGYGSRDDDFYKRFEALLRGERLFVVQTIKRVWEGTTDYTFLWTKEEANAEDQQ